MLFLERSQIPNQNIVIVYLDEESYRDLKQSPTDFDRSLHTRLIRKLKDEGAKLVVFDILFIDPKSSNAAVDDDLARAMRAHGKVVLSGHHEDDELLGSGIIAPVDPLRDACAGWGIATVDRDMDFEPRRHREDSDRIPSLAWKSAEVMRAEITCKPEVRRQERWLNYYSPDPFDSVSYKTVFDNTLPIGFFKDKLVFVGSGGDVAGYRGDLKEQFRSPWTWRTGRYHDGVEIHAITFCNLVQQDWLWQLSDNLQYWIILVVGAALGYGLCLFRPVAATGVACAFAVLLTAASFFLFARFNLWFPWLIPVAAQIPLALLWSWLFYSIISYTQTKILETSLALYLSPHQVRHIQKQPELLKPGGLQQTVSILFSDIANFSGISEGMDPNALVNLLNVYYETAIGCVHETEGTVMKLIGDSIFAIWNAPQEQPDHQQRACRAALLLNEKLIRFDAGIAPLQLRTRIGLHTGLVCVGNIGSSARFDYTAIGENVNIASRLEGLNKQLGTNILATREIQASLEGRIITRAVGQFRFKGFEKAVEVYEIISPVESAQASQPWRETFEKALCDFQNQQFDAAAEGFRQTLILHPEDGPSRFYLVKAAELQKRTLPKDWRGEIELLEK